MSSSVISDKIKKASENHYYMVVEEEGKVTLDHHLVIGGALARWPKHPNFVYCPESRLAGSHDRVKWAMEQMKWNDYTLYTAKSTKDIAFLNEVASYESYTESQRKEKFLDPELYAKIASEMSHCRIHKATSESKRYTYKKPVERFTHLADNEVLDVSRRESDGKGSHVVAKTKVPQGHLYGNKDIPIVSDNIASYKLELESIGAWSSHDIGQATATLTRNLTEFQMKKVSEKKKSDLAIFQEQAVKQQSTKQQVAKKVGGKK